MSRNMKQPVGGCRLSLGLALLLLHWSGSAWAAGNVPASRDLTEVPLENLLTMEVQSASRYRQAASEAPSAVSVITSTEIKTYGWRTLAEILRSLPGVYISNDRTYTTVGTRGMSRVGDYNIRFLLMIDGHRINDPLYDQAMMGQEFMLDVDLIDRVEYVPGPGSAMYGSNAFFGVINVITKRGRDFNGAQVSAEGGSAHTHRERATVGGMNADGVEWLLSATNHDSKGKDLHFAPIGGSSPAFGGVAHGLDYEKVQSVFAKGSAGPFSISLAHAERKKGTPTAEYSQSFDDPRSGFFDSMSFLNIGYAKALNERSDFSARLFYNQTRYHGYYAYPDTGVDYDASSAKWWGGEAKLVSTAIASHKLVTGAEFQMNSSIRQWNVNLDSGVTSLNRRDNNYRLGLYAQDEWTLYPDWILSLGLRYDHVTETAEQNYLNPRLGLIRKITPSTTAKLLFGKAYRLPNFYEMYYNDGPIGVQAANPALRPEHIRSSEFVLEHQWSAGNRVRASVFLNKVKDLITSEETSPGSGVTWFNNIDSATAWGVTAEWQQAWKEGTHLRTSLSWQKATDDATGAVLSNAPKWLGKINATTPFWDRLWRAGAEVQFVSTRNAASSRLGGYTLANLTVSSNKLYKGIEVSASVYNLFDRHYTEPVGADFTPDAIAQDGRTFRVKLTYNF